jgi:uncharacterized metal-binding protein
MDRPHQKPLVYSCSDCSSTAQLANAVALKLDRAGIAERSCIAGVGGDVRPLVRLARSGRPIVALGGCAPARVKNALVRQVVEPSVHGLLTGHGARKRYHADFDPVQAQRVFADVSRRIARAIPAPGTRATAPVSPAVGEGACQ